MNENKIDPDRKAMLQSMLAGSAAIIGKSAPELAAVIVIGVTTEVSTDDSFRRGLLAMSMRPPTEKQKLYIKMGMDILAKAMEMDGEEVKEDDVLGIKRENN